MNVARIADAKTFASKAEEVARRLEALANPRRLMILCELADGELLPIIGLQQAALSQHLARLRAEGIVVTRRESQAIFYRLGSPSAVATINTLADILCWPSKPKRRSQQ